ncbi:MAG: hypothetical protein HC867_02470 [Bacteroidia bacterium]|nr:hypothetical protein [Bacteroidia bacterium]
MKKLYLTLISILIVFFSLANPVITADKNNGKWRSNSTWDLNRKPQDGDTVVIPVGLTVILDNNINLQNATLYIKVYGSLIIDGGHLKLDENSQVILYSTGNIAAEEGKNSEYIKIGNEFKFRGTENYIAGPAYANAATGAAPNGFASNGGAALPVKFIGFNVASQNNNVLIEWATAQETNSSHFDIQRSENGSNWQTIATLNAAGSSSVTKNYSFTDRGVTAKVLYYRIKQIDRDGRSEITAVRSVKMDAGKIQVKISSGSNNSVYLHFSEQVRSNVVVQIMTMNGQIVAKQTLSNPVGQQNISVRNSGNKGVFVVTVSDVQNVNSSGQIFLQ